MLPVVFGALGLMGLAAANEGVEAPVKLVPQYGFKGALAPAEGVSLGMIDMISGAFYAGFMLPERFQDGKIEATIEWLQRSIQGDQGRELAIYLTHEPGFGKRRIKTSMVKNAVLSSALPGFDGTWEEPLRSLWSREDPSWWGWITGNPSVSYESISAYFRADVPRLIKGFLGETGIGVMDDQIVNSLAIGIYLHSLNPLVGDKIYEWIAEQINIDAAGKSRRSPHHWSGF